MLIELEDGTVKNLHYAVAAKVLKAKRGIVYEGERKAIEKPQVKNAEIVKKPRAKKTK